MGRISSEPEMEQSIPLRLEGEAWNKNANGFLHFTHPFISELTIILEKV